MSNKRAILVKSNTLEKDTRFPKEIVTLTRNGFEVTFLGWDRELKEKRQFFQDAGQSYHENLFKLKAPYGPKIFLFLPLWWLFVSSQLLDREWDIVQAGDFISILPALFVGKIKKKPVIYEILDVYVDQIILPSIIRTTVINIDKIFMRFANCIILADKEEILELNGIPNKYIVEIFDSPPDENSDFKPFKEKNPEFTIFFAGYLVKSRQLNLDKIIHACFDIDGVKIIIAGYGDLSEEISNFARLMPNKIKFIGELTHSEVLRISKTADLLFVLRNPIVPVNKYICGSKVLEAMMCGTAFLANKGTSTANIVIQENFGFAVDANNIDEIKSAIIILKNDPQLIEKFRSNARNAYVNKYGWHLMEKRLIEVFNKLS